MKRVISIKWDFNKEYSIIDYYKHLVATTERNTIEAIAVFSL